MPARHDPIPVRRGNRYRSFSLALIACALVMVGWILPSASAGAENPWIVPAASPAPVQAGSVMDETIAQVGHSVDPSPADYSIIARPLGSLTATSTQTSKQTPPAASTPTGTTLPSTPAPTATPSAVGTPTPSVPSVQMRAPTPTPAPVQVPLLNQIPMLARTPIPAAPALPPGPIVNVPVTIDQTGAKDVTVQLANWLRTVPDGATVAFEASSRYRLDGNLMLLGRVLTIDGHGATVFSVSRNVGDSMFEPVEGSLTIRNLTLDGGAAEPGKRQVTWGAASFEMGIASRGARLTVDHVTIRNFNGDGIYLGANYYNHKYGTNGTFSHDVWIHDSTITGVGRDAVSLTQAERVLGERLVIRNIALHAWNNEPNLATKDVPAPPNDERIRDITFRDSDMYAPIGDYVYASNGWGNASRITVERIHVHGKQLRVIIAADATHRRQAIRFTDCTSDTPISGPTMWFSHVDGLLVVKNVQPLLSGTGLAVTDSTSVTLALSKVPSKTGSTLSGTRARP
jgi:hypothetical protein